MAKSELIGEAYSNLTNSLGNLSNSLYSEGIRQKKEKLRNEAEQEDAAKASKAEDSLFQSNQYKLEAAYRKSLGSTMQSLPDLIDFNSYDQRVKDFNVTFVSEAKASGVYDERTLSWLENEFIPQQSAGTEKAVEGVKNFAIYNWLATAAASQANVFAADSSLSVDYAYAKYKGYYDRVGLGNIPNGNNDYGIFTPDEFKESIRGTKALQAFQSLSANRETGYLFSADYNMDTAMQEAMREAGYNPNLIDEAQFQADCNKVLANIESAVHGEVDNLCQQVEGVYNDIMTSPDARSTAFDLSSAYEAAKSYPPQYLSKFVNLAAKIEKHNSDVQYNVATDSITRGQITGTVLKMLDAGYQSTHEKRFKTARDSAVSQKILEEARLNGNNDPSQVMEYIYNGKFSITISDEDRYNAATEFHNSLKSAYDTISGYSDLVVKINSDKLAGSPVPDMLSALYDVEVTYPETAADDSVGIHTEKIQVQDVEEGKYPDDATFVFHPKYEFTFQGEENVPLAQKKIFEDSKAPNTAKSADVSAKARSLGLDSSKGNIDIYEDFEQAQNEDGTVSTINTISIGVDGKEVLIPTTWDGKNHTTKEAIERYNKTGLNFGMFDTIEEADDYANRLHQLEEQKVAAKAQSETVGSTKPEALPTATSTALAQQPTVGAATTTTVKSTTNSDLPGVYTASSLNKLTSQRAEVDAGGQVVDNLQAKTDLEAMAKRGAPQAILNSMARYYEDNELLSEKTISEIVNQKSWRKSENWDLLNLSIDSLLKDLDVSEATARNVKKRITNQVSEAFRYSGQTWDEFEKGLTKLIDMLTSKEILSETMSKLERFNKVSQAANSYCETLTSNGIYGQLFQDYANGKFDGLVNYGLIQKVQDMNIVGNDTIRNEIAKLMNHESYETALQSDPIGMTKLIIETMTAIVNMYNEAGEFYEHVSDRLNEYGISASLLDFTIDPELGYVFIDSNSAKRGYALCIDPELMVYESGSGISAQWKYAPIIRNSDDTYKIDRSKEIGDMGQYAQVGSNLFLTTKDKPFEDLLSGQWAEDVEESSRTAAGVNRSAGMPSTDYSWLTGWLSKLVQRNKTKDYKKQSANEEATFVEAYKTAFGLWEN